MPKAGAKASTPKRTRDQPAPATPPAKQGRAVPADLLVPIDAGDWPTNLEDETARKLFEAIEGGRVPKYAAIDLGLNPNLVTKWKVRHPEFRKRIEEAIDIGIESQIDDCVEISDTAVDRDSAAAAQERRKGREEYRKLRRPERFNVTANKPSLPGAGDFLLGVVVLPAKQTLLPGDHGNFIEGEATVVLPQKGPLE